MVSKSKQQANEPKGKPKKVKVDKLKLNKETVKDLSRGDMKGVRGGRQSGACGLGTDGCDSVYCR